ncbi:hypothetical protein HMPREF9057_00357 [Actinomyces sp. oral taxon 171 str. F0337]|nr:hypothetical protein HMPREF9057_00357 [Actinomyces sp. oral taxon 171 str. F0337]
MKRKCGRAKPTHAPPHLTPPPTRGSAPHTPRASTRALRMPTRRMPKRQQGATPRPKVLRLTRFRGKIVA